MAPGFSKEGAEVYVRALVCALLLYRLQVQQQLSNRILLAFLDVARTAAEADCEEERADQLADGLQGIRDKRIRRYTLIAIVGDAMIGTVSGGIGPRSRGHTRRDGGHLVRPGGLFRRYAL